MTQKHTRIAVTLPTLLVSALKAHASNSGAPASFFIRKALENYFRNQNIPLPDKTLAPKPTDIRKNLDNTYTRIDDSTLVTYRDGKEIKREALSYGVEGEDWVGRLNGIEMDRKPLSK